MTADRPGSDSSRELQKNLPTPEANLDLQANLQAIADLVQKTANYCQSDTVQLLQLLRLLESEHRQIREGNFLNGLPSSRQALYQLLRDMEQSGGWPYIPSMTLRTILAKLEQG